jgi:hypothetical protein
MATYAQLLDAILTSDSLNSEVKITTAHVLIDTMDATPEIKQLLKQALAAPKSVP